jgi:hypothetical protein
MEELILTDPVIEPEKVSTKYRVVSFTMNLEAQPMLTLEPGLVAIELKDNLGVPFTHVYTGATATTMIKQLNTANLSVKSMHKRILEKLSTDGVLPGTVTGTPDP